MQLWSGQSVPDGLAKVNGRGTDRGICAVEQAYPICWRSTGLSERLPEYPVIINLSGHSLNSLYVGYYA